MKIVSLKSKLAVAASLAVVGIFGASHVVVAQPGAGAGAGAGKKKGGKRGGLAPKVQEKIETALGKPLTAEQKTELGTAAKEQRKAVADAQEKFDTEVARVTGLPIEKVRELKKKPGQAAKPNN
ncbi:hypothetical protein EON83_19800 [bacterium]|nr:MAG: hypothetical protein EON83_19800 [bacterium]